MQDSQQSTRESTRRPNQMHAGTSSTLSPTMQCHVQLYAKLMMMMMMTVMTNGNAGTNFGTFGFQKKNGGGVYAYRFWQLFATREGCCSWYAVEQEPAEPNLADLSSSSILANGSRRTCARK